MPQRTYTSELRREQANQTRRKVIAAALELFSRDGYGPTSIAKIAQSAGVSPETVRSVGPKRALLEEASVFVTFGDELPEVTDIPLMMEMQGIDTSGPEAWTASMSTALTEINRRAAGLFRAWAAAAEDPEVAESWDAQQRSIRANWGVFIAWLDEQGWITSTADRGQLTTTVWLLTLADTYTRITITGDDDDAYRRWLEASLSAVLFP